MADYDCNRLSPSFRRKIKIKRSICRFASLSSVSSSSSSSSGSEEDGWEDGSHASQVSRSPASWMRSVVQDLPSLMSRAGTRRRRRRACCSSEYRYDPVSYALNFDDQSARADDCALRNFSAKLPAA